MSKKVTMRDIGQALGVSTVTVSKALGGREGVSERVRQQIIQAAQEMGYVYESGPSGSLQDPIVGVVIADRYFGVGTFYAALYKELVKELMDQGMLGVLEIIPLEKETAAVPPALITGHTAHALMVVGQMQPAYLQMLNDSGLPMILVDFYADDIHTDAVISDGLMGTLQLTRELIALGHRQIGFVGTVRMTSSSMDRFSGYARAMDGAHLEVRPEWVLEDRNEQGDFLPELQLPDQLPTAFVCENDVIAGMLIAQLQARQLRVPEDVSVTGFDNHILGIPPAVPLTTYAVDLSRIAEISAKRLQQRMARRWETPLRIIVSGEVLHRDSVSAPPARQMA